MSIKKTCDKVKKGIDEGVYKMVRLLQRHKQGSKFTDTVLITCNKMGRENALARIKHIEFELTNDLPPGLYIIQCLMGTTMSGSKKNFEVQKTAPIKILESKTGISKSNEPVHDYTNTNQDDPMTLEEYKKLVDENAELRAERKMLLFEIDALKREIQRIDANPLNDSGGTLGPVLDTLKDMAPSVMGAVEKLLEQRDRSLSIREKSLNQNKVSLRKPMKQKPTREDVADYIEELLESNPDKANEELDNIENSNPELYQYLVEELGLEEMEEDVEEEEEQN